MSGNDPLKIVVVNGRLLTSTETKELLKREKEQQDGKEKGRKGENDGRDDDLLKKRRGEGGEEEVGEREGFERVITLHGVSRSMEEKQKLGKKSQKYDDDGAQEEGKRRDKDEEDEPSTTTIVCFRSIHHRQLQSAAFESIDGVTLNECR